MVSFKVTEHKLNSYKNVNLIIRSESYFKINRTATTVKSLSVDDDVTVQHIFYTYIIKIIHVQLYMYNNCTYFIIIVYV